MPVNWRILVQNWARIATNKSDFVVSSKAAFHDRRRCDLSSSSAPPGVYWYFTTNALKEVQAPGPLFLPCVSDASVFASFHHAKRVVDKNGLAFLIDHLVLGAHQPVVFCVGG